jgi:hypothetical protein
METEIAGLHQCWREAQRTSGEVYGMIGWIMTKEARWRRL